MLTLHLTTLLVILFSINVDAHKLHRRAYPSVALDYGTFKGSNLGSVDSFTGVPYAAPPVGYQRFRDPIWPTQTYPTYDATKPAPYCPQQNVPSSTSADQYIPDSAKSVLKQNGVYKVLNSGQEDCLTIDVRRPVGVTGSIPVMMYFYGGGNAVGSTNSYDGSNLVYKSMNQGSPVIHVAANYRLNAFGYLGGKQIADAGAGNLGLKDQRLAMKWVQKYIGQFGGDPNKVTIYGQGSGASSLSYHLFAYNGQYNGLFRAAIMQSGAPSNLPSIYSAQPTYDAISKQVGCGTGDASLECLRNAPYSAIMDAVNSQPTIMDASSYSAPFTPVIDGYFLTDNMPKLLKAGKYAKVPIISGNQDDEGTYLTLGQTSLNSQPKLFDFLKGCQLLKGSPLQLLSLFGLYFQDPLQGSPFGTGAQYAITPVYKPFAGMYGDSQFHAPRRYLLKNTQAYAPTYSYINRAQKSTPYLGSYHGSELPYVFGQTQSPLTDEFQSRWISFATNLHPNPKGYATWPQYGLSGNMMILKDSGYGGVTQDTYRSPSINYYMNNNY